MKYPFVTASSGHSARPEISPIVPIGVVHSCYKTKFGIPRQPGLVTAATGVIEMLPPYNHRDAFRGLEDFSHVWITFVFHLHQRETWSPLVRPPRLGGNIKMGVFATRSTFRPNNIGLSVVRLACVDTSVPGHVLLHLVSLSPSARYSKPDQVGLDLVDGTPVLDVKPYLPYAGAVPLSIKNPHHLHNLSKVCRLSATRVRRICARPPARQAERRLQWFVCQYFCNIR